MKVQRAAAVALLTEIGLVVADKWSDDKLAGKLRGIDKLVDDSSQPTTADSKKLLENVLSAIEAGEEFEVESSGSGAKPKGKGRASKPAAPEKPKSKGNKTPAPAKDKIEKDKFGCRVGSVRARANAALTKKPKKISQIVEDAKLPWPPFNHLNEMVAKGFVTKSDDGYALKGK